MPSDITNIIITLSTISISMFQLIMGKLDDRILGMSYKKIFVKDIIWKYGNFPNSAIILLEIIAISCILEIFGSYTDVKILQCVLLIVSVGISCWTFILGIIALTKKSKVYYIIKKKLTSGKSKDYDIAL